MDWNKVRVGDKETIVYEWRWQECAECGIPARYRVAYLLENARSNPASSGYKNDDITWCSDDQTYACKHHSKLLERNAPSGYSWAATFPLKRFKHMGFYKAIANDP